MGVEPGKRTTELFESIRAGGIPEVQWLPKAGPSAPAARPWMPIPSAVPFVGFESELGQLERQLASGLSGRARVALISGEAGSGKTTLLAEFTRRALVAQGDLLVAFGGCNAQFGYGDPYLPFRQALHMLTGDLEGIRCAGALSEEHTSRLWTALPAVLEALLAEGPELVGTFLPLEGLTQRAHISGEQGAEAITQLEALAARRAQERLTGASRTGQASLFDPFTRVLLAIARRYPLILALDDLQWADRGSLSLLFHLARNLGDGRVLVIGAYRPEDLIPERSGARHPMESLVNELLAQYGEVRVDLSRAAGWDFVNGLLDSEPNDLDEAFRRALFQLTEGQPLFTVEQLRAMQECGGLVKDEAGRLVIGENLDWERIPARVRAVIAERLARPSAECRTILEAASVQGETFGAETLAIVLGESEAHLVERLSGELCRQHQLVFVEGLRRLGDVSRSRYRFRHALYQRQLYEGLDAVRRARLHQATAEALEQRYAQHVADLTAAEDSAARLAFHFEKAGLGEKAVFYHRRAGERAYRLAANEEAIYHYNRALEILESMPESGEQTRQELLILISLSAALNAARGYAEPELRPLSARAVELAARSGEVDLISRALYLKGGYHYARAEYQSTLETGAQMMGLFSNNPIPWMSNIANFLLGIARLNTGEFTLACEHLCKIKTADDIHQASGAQLLADRYHLAYLTYPAFLSWAYWLLGYPDKALGLSQQLLARARGMGYPYVLAFVLGMSSCLIHAFRREIDELQERAQELISLSTEKGFGLPQAWGRLFLGKAQVRQGEFETGLANIRAGLCGYRATGHISILTMMLALQAEACAAAGRIDEGLESLFEASCLADENGERFYEAELHRLHGELLLATSGVESEVEACFQKALQVARGQEAKSLELRAAASLAQLWARQGKASQARDMLGAVYNWFKEGLDTPDLEQAAHLLAGLEI